MYLRLVFEDLHFPSTPCHVHAERGGWVTHQPRSLLISLTDLDLDQRPPRYGCPTICIQDSIKALARPFEPARIPEPASSDLNYAIRSSRWRICLCLCTYFCLFPLSLSLSLSQDTSSQVTGFQLALERSTRQKNRLILILIAPLAKIPW